MIFNRFHCCDLIAVAFSFKKVSEMFVLWRMFFYNKKVCNINGELYVKIIRFSKRVE